MTETRGGMEKVEKKHEKRESHARWPEGSQMWLGCGVKHGNPVNDVVFGGIF
jgi:hypothetical protein